jgi:hypothetical protein
MQKQSVRATFCNEYVDTYISGKPEIGYSPTTGATLTYFEKLKQQPESIILQVS